MAVYNVDKISNWYDDFISEKKKFNNYYSNYKSSYISNCSEEVVRKMKSYLDKNFSEVEKKFKKIEKVWKEYLVDLKNTDRRLAGGKGSINASSVSSKISKLPTLKEYKRSLDIRIKSASAVIGVNGNNVFNNMKTSYDVFREYTGARATTWISSIFSKTQESFKDTGAKIKSLFKDNSNSDKESQINVASVGNPDNDKKIHFKNVTLLSEKGTYVVYDYKETDASGITRYYDENGNVFKICYADGSYEIKNYSIGFYYDKDGKKHKVDTSYSNIMIDDSDRRITGSVTSIKYNKDGSVEYFEKDKILQKIYSDGSEEKYTYDYGYSNGVKVEYKYSDGSSEIKVNGKTTSKMDKDGTKYEYSFKNGYHLDKITRPNGDEIYYYADGKISKEKKSDGSIKTYYINGELASEEKPNGDKYSYSDNLVRIYHNDGTWETKEYLTSGKYKGYYIYRENTNDYSSLGTLYDKNGNKIADKVVKGGMRGYGDGRTYDIIIINGKEVEY